LCVEQRTESKKGRKSYQWPFDDRHTLAVFFIKHPLGNHELISAGKKQLNLVPRLTGKRNPPNDRHRLAKLRMMRIVNRQGNMGSV
jgi:hypothetical protein